MEGQSKGSSLGLGAWGVLSVVYGMFILAWPGITLKVFLIVLGIYFLVSGVFLALGSVAKRGDHWVGGLIMGLFSVIAGLYVFAHPALSVLALLTVIAIWAIVVGAMQISAGFEADLNDNWLIFSGFVQALFGLYIFANPKGGALALIWLVGLAAIVSGLAMTVAAFQSGKLVKA